MTIVLTEERSLYSIATKINGDYQKITPTEPIHELLHNPTSPPGVVEFFPAHPHRGLRAFGCPCFLNMGRSRRGF
ncbi:hypothetical protein [Gloeocapsopsis dulcis]|uniref:Uncharacterized protein n=1 Tax=Gloeocapsopsis dulcis AAB1 = 1H9 TaxID=1433147 RepID=A0A6N8FY25_9CHRO|nr:hypothetical protein [Gloeocapsopsis dulcis]MUL37739.1 hypothetical protein [Gloeocapsopsis dulcis AAB1 = 1H9]WNN90642.1 hypothetical protein P0S91_06035 [Gloeocapsopsis dulcis]